MSGIVLACCKHTHTHMKRCFTQVCCSHIREPHSNRHTHTQSHQHSTQIPPALSNWDWLLLETTIRLYVRVRKLYWCELAFETVWESLVFSQHSVEIVCGFFFFFFPKAFFLLSCSLFRATRINECFFLCFVLIVPSIIYWESLTGRVCLSATDSIVCYAPLDTEKQFHSAFLCIAMEFHIILLLLFGSNARTSDRINEPNESTYIDHSLAHLYCVWMCSCSLCIFCTCCALFHWKQRANKQPFEWKYYVNNSENIRPLWVVHKFLKSTVSTTTSMKRHRVVNDDCNDDDNTLRKAEKLSVFQKHF